MTTTVSGSYPAVNSDSDATINGLTVGKGAGTVSTNTAVGASALSGSNTGSANTFGTYGVTNPDLVVCNTASWTNYPTTTPSCTTSTLAITSTNQYTGTAWTYTTSVFAYDYYTTPIVNQLMGNYIYNINFYRAGWR